MDLTCAQCFQQLPHSSGDKIPRAEECPHCSASLRVCKMCRHYDPHSYNQCLEPVAERITDKEKANFCDFFTLDHRGSQVEESSAHRAAAAAAALFKK